MGDGILEDERIVQLDSRNVSHNVDEQQGLRITLGFGADNGRQALSESAYETIQGVHL